MNQAIRRTLVVFPLSLLFAGCHGAHRSEFRHAPAHTSARPVVLHSTSPIEHNVPAAHRSEFRYAPAHTSARPVVLHSTSPIERNVPPGEAGFTFTANKPPSRAIATGSRYDITLDEFRGHLQNNTAVIMDAREPEDFAVGHIRGALNLPADQKEAYMRKISREVGTSQFIIIYCGGPHCNAGDKVYDYAASQGYSNMRVFKPGWETLASSRDLQ